jgi:hypothetical protein
MILSHNRILRSNLTNEAMESYWDSVLAVIMTGIISRFMTEHDKYLQRDSHESDDGILNMLAPAAELIWIIHMFLQSDPPHPITQLQKVLDPCETFIDTPMPMHRIRVLKHIIKLIQRAQAIFSFDKVAEIIHTLESFHELRDPDVAHDSWPIKSVLLAKIRRWKSRLAITYQFLKQWSNYRSISILYLEVQVAHATVKDFAQQLRQWSLTSRKAYFTMKHKLTVIQVSLRNHCTPSWRGHFDHLENISTEYRTQTMPVHIVSNSKDRVLLTIVTHLNIQVDQTEFFPRTPSQMAHLTNY